MIQKAVPDNLSRTPIQRQEGFLNLMSDVIKKLGFGIINFIPTFLDLILTIIEHINANINMVEEKQINTKQHGKVCSLCFLQISEFMAKFASQFNLNPFKVRLWKTLGPTLLNLSSSVINAEKPPSLLILLVTMSSHPKLINILVDEGQAVKAAFECISVQSKAKVVDCALKFIDNLLTEGGLYEEGSVVNDTHKERYGVSD